MITLRKSGDRGRAQSEWLDSRYSFSFAEYHDPKNVHFSVLRVLNEDSFPPGTGFPSHPHREVEIVTYLLEGTLEHEDSMGNRQRLVRGDVQRMSAGTGVQHSETNPSATDPVRLFQVWIFSDAKGAPPEYEHRHFSDDEKRGHLRVIVSPDGRGGSLRIRQDASLYAGIFDAGQSVNYGIAEGRRVYLHLACGGLSAGEFRLEGGDALMVDGESGLEFAASRDGTELLLFDLP